MKTGGSRACPDQRSVAFLKRRLCRKRPYCLSTMGAKLLRPDRGRKLTPLPVCRTMGAAGQQTTQLWMFELRVLVQRESQSVALGVSLASAMFRDEQGNTYE